ncbi:unnamed protein product [Cercopithifilaria johnstoni]|uniref:Uncharacterized protein n=1 Tax=Cercopithifilaria johnstoni TaxID=2874296 RepID=A0A8J2M8Q7_9BILA|nr:unnamed protein product [Cercopithifilaria johnstoni]
MQGRFVLILFLSIFINIYPTKAKATSATRSRDNHKPAPTAEISDEIVTVLDDAVRLADAEPELHYDSLIPTSDSKSKHELEHSADGIGRMRRSCGGGCGGGCGCGCGCGCGGGCSCCQKSCCSTTTTCTTCTTTCCKTCCQQCCQSCCGCGSCGCGCGCGGGSGGGEGCGGRKKREIMELLGGGNLIRGKRSPKSRRKYTTDGAPIKKTIKV